MVSLPGKPSSGAKKRQQASLVPLPGTPLLGNYLSISMNMTQGVSKDRLILLWFSLFSFDLRITGTICSDSPHNYIADPLRHLIPSSSSIEIMAEKVISSSSQKDSINNKDVKFPINSGLKKMVQSKPFAPNDDAVLHLWEFNLLCNTTIIKGVSPDALRLKLFPYSLKGKARNWFYSHHKEFTTWEECATTFTHSYIPREKAVTIQIKIITFCQSASETIAEACERYQGHLWTCPNHGMKEDFLLHNFYDSLRKATKKQLNIPTREVFLSLSIKEVAAVIEKIVNNDLHGIQKDEPRKVEPPMTDEAKKSLDSLHTKLRDLTKETKSQSWRFAPKPKSILRQLNL